METLTPLSDFLANNPSLAVFFVSPSDPEKVGLLKVLIFSLLIPVVLLILGLILRVFSKNLGNKLLSFTKVILLGGGYLLSPIEKALNFSASLIQGTISRHYNEPSPKRFFKEEALSIVGALCVATFSYLIAISFYLLANGVKIKTLDVMIGGDWNSRVATLQEFAAQNALLNITVLTIAFSYIINKAKVNYLENRNWQLVHSGVELVLPLARWDETPKLTIPEEELVTSYKKTVKRLLSPSRVTRIRVKLASAHDAFGPDGYLLDLLKRTGKRWEILILDPGSDAAKLRAEAYLSERAGDSPIKTADEYLGDIRVTLDKIKKIRDEQNNNIEVRLFTHVPQWKMYLVGDYALVQAFGPGQRSDRSSLVIIKNTATSLFHGYSEMFDDIWRDNEKNRV